MRLVRAWCVVSGSRLGDGRIVTDVHREAVGRIVALTLHGPEGVDREVWLGEAPLPVEWQPGDKLPHRHPGAALGALIRRWGL